MSEDVETAADVGPQGACSSGLESPRTSLTYNYIAQSACCGAQIMLRECFREKAVRLLRTVGRQFERS